MDLDLHMNTFNTTAREDSSDRFAFGKNWAQFLSSIDEEKIMQACASLTAMTGFSDLHGKTFLDIGSGSGLFSLAAHRMGASVTSFDYDVDSVRCTELLRERFSRENPPWQVMQGSVLDTNFMAGLGVYDVVYSWGVLHHTGAMWSAVDLAATTVKPDGLLFIALYNDQGWRSAKWLQIKKLYNRLPTGLRRFYVGGVMLPYEARSLIGHLVRGIPMEYIRTWTHYGAGAGRGMKKWRDWVDWVGGLPFEVAKPDQVLEALRQKGFELERMITRLGGWGCNEFVFRRRSNRSDLA